MQESSLTTTGASAPSAETIISRVWRLLKYVVYTVFVVLSDTYGVFTTIMLLVKWLVGERWWPVGLFNSLIPAVLLPAFIMLPGSLLIRRWRLALFTIPPVAAFLFYYGGLFFPRRIDVDPDAPQVILLTYNTHSETSDLQPMVDLILEANPDMVALQELTQAAADYFAVRLADRYPYQALHPVGPTVRGKGFFSRYPLLNDSVWPDESWPKFQRVEVDANGSLLTIYNTHPSIPYWGFPYNASARGQDIAALLESAENDDGLRLIVGDFNMTDQSDDYRKITGLYADTYREVGRGLGPTFPDFTFSTTLLRVMPQFLRLDYVFHSDGFQAVQARVWHTSGGSDHHPLLVRLAITSP